MTTRAHETTGGAAPSAVRGLLAALVVGVLALSGAAQDAATLDGDSVASLRDAISAVRAELVVDDTRSDEEREEVDAALVQASEQLDVAGGWSEAAAAATLDLAEGPFELARLEAERQEAPVLPDEVPPEAAADVLAPRLADAEAELRAAQAAVDALEDAIAQAEERRASLPEVLTAARTHLAEIEARLQKPPGEDVDVVLDTARRLVDRARRIALLGEIASYERERDAAEIRDQLRAARLTAETRRRTALEQRVEAWRLRLADLRRIEAEEAARAARDAARRAAQEHPVVERLASANADLAQARTGAEGLLARIEGIAKELDDTRERLSELSGRQTRVEQRCEAAGDAQSVGFLLVNERARLPDVAALRRAIETRREETSEIQLQRFDLRDASAELIDVDESVEGEMAELKPPIVDVERRRNVELAIREQYERRREYLDQLTEDYGEYLRLAGDLELAERDLIAMTEDFASFIDARVLWVRIASPLYEDPAGLWQSLRDDLRWLTGVPAWSDFARALTVTMQRDGLAIALRIVMLIAFLALRPALRRRIADTAELVRRLRTDQFRHTAHVFGLTAMLALAVPLVLWFLANLLQVTALEMNRGADVIGAVASGLLWVAAALLVTGFVVRASRPLGLAEVHFRWPVESLTTLRSNLQWFLVLAMPVSFVVATMFARHGTGLGDSLGRCAFIVLQLLLAVFAYRVMHPGRGVVAALLADVPNGWLSRLRGLWFPLVVGLPLALVVLAVLGYTYSALQLTLRMLESTLLIFVVVFSRALLLRWLHVARRRLAVQQYLKRRRGEDGESEEGDVDEIDVESVSEQSQRLVQFAVSIAFLVGMWLIWSSVLPALTSEDVDIPLWDTTIEKTITRPGADGVDRLITERVTDFVTLGDVLLAIAVLVITFVAGSNLPGLLEIAVLQKLPFQQAGRYAITTISRYLILIIGVIMAFGVLEIGWGEVQWLAAAVTVGLGFGLQEVFANFVSGLILLFERPMRVGDTVTVGDVTGAVTRIRMRATTIVTWDRTELIVPNREFITTKVVNWTLSDSVLRVIARVGIAYGSNVDRAEAILYKIARENEHVLPDPAPRVVFTSFGDSTLDFELRLFVTSPELYRTIHHQLNKAIDAQFREAGIEIAFPQRDLHLRTADVPLAIVRREEIGGIAAADSADAAAGVARRDAGPGGPPPDDAAAASPT